MDSATLFADLWPSLGWPLCRLLLSIAVGLMVGNLIEALNWTRAIARLATPLLRLGHLSETAGASFTMAFFSSTTANTVLAEAHDKGTIDRRQLILANLFNSVPTYFLHLPTMFFLALSMIRSAALAYVGITLGAAFLRTATVLLVGRLLLPAPEKICVSCVLEDNGSKSWPQAFEKAWSRFQRRMGRIARFTVPIYVVFFFFNRFGLFDAFESFLAERLSFLAWLEPATIPVVALQLTAEVSAGLAAAGALLDAGSVTEQQLVLALLAGNVLSAPMRAARHQFPFYAGIFSPRLATVLIFWNQSFRTASILLVSIFYYLLSA